MWLKSNGKETFRGALVSALSGGKSGAFACIFQHTALTLAQQSLDPG